MPYSYGIVSPVPCRDLQNSMGNMEHLPSGNCSLFTVVPACVHDIAQLGRYLKFLGFIFDQSCVQSSVSRDENRYIVWWTIAHWEDISREVRADGTHCVGCSPSLVHYSSAAMRLHLPLCAAPWRWELLRASPHCIYLAEHGTTQLCAPRSPFAMCLSQYEAVVCPSGRVVLVRLAMAATCLFFLSLILWIVLQFGDRKAV